jgi:hypothetical protein
VGGAEAFIGEGGEAGLEAGVASAPSSRVHAHVERLARRSRLRSLFPAPAEEVIARIEHELAQSS